MHRPTFGWELLDLLLVLQVVRDAMGLASGGSARPDTTSGLVLEISGAHETCDAVSTLLERSCIELLIHPS